MKFNSKRIISIITVMVSVVLIFAGCVNDTSYSGTLNIIDVPAVSDQYLSGSVILIDARGKEAYDKGHVKNAVALSPAELVVDKPVNATLAPKDKVERVLSNLGIANDDTLYIYDGDGGVSASRVWWTLKVYGHEKVMIINGGEQEILKAGLELSTEAPKLAKSEYVASEPNQSLISDFEAVKAVVENKDSKVKIIDVRSIAEYEAGNIPGAILYPHTNNLYTDGTFKSARDTYLFYSDKGIEREDQIILYCKSSFRATETLALLQEAGYENVTVYDGAWLEWSENYDLSGSQVEKAPVTVQDGS